MDQKLMEKALATYTAVMLGLTPEENVQAFSRGLEEAKFLPAPATLREYSGRAPSGDPIASEAREELFKIVAPMRGKHRPKLKGIPGRAL